MTAPCPFWPDQRRHVLQYESLHQWRDYVSLLRRGCVRRAAGAGKRDEARGQQKNAPREGSSEQEGRATREESEARGERGLDAYSYTCPRSWRLTTAIRTVCVSGGGTFGRLAWSSRVSSKKSAPRSSASPSWSPVGGSRWSTSLPSAALLWKTLAAACCQGALRKQ